MKNLDLLSKRILTISLSIAIVFISASIFMLSVKTSYGDNYSDPINIQNNNEKEPIEGRYIISSPVVYQPIQNTGTKATIFIFDTHTGLGRWQSN